MPNDENINATPSESSREPENNNFGVPQPVEANYSQPPFPQSGLPTPPPLAYPFYQTPDTTYQQAAPQPAYPAFQQPHKKARRLAPTLVALSLISALAGGGVGGTIVALSDDGATVSSTASRDSSVKTVSEVSTSDLTDVIQEKLSSIVTVSVVDGQSAGTGSGVVMNSEGYIITNAHVATLAGETDSGVITVQTSTGDTYDAKLVGFDPTADIAVLQIDKTAKGITPIEFASSDDVTVGSQAIAIGSPLGLSGTVTTGIVSALNRPITVESSEVSGSNAPQQAANTVALSAIQTDAAINSGNSGGALLDGNGNLIGINVAIASTSESSGSIGVGFAIPSDYVKRVASQLIADGKATHGYLGASITDYATVNSAFTSGAQIQNIEAGTPASKSGLQSGDIITKVNDNTIESATQLTALIKQQDPGSKVTITYLRGAESSTTDIVLGES